MHECYMKWKIIPHDEDVEVAVKNIRLFIKWTLYVLDTEADWGSVCVWCVDCENGDVSVDTARLDAVNQQCLDATTAKYVTHYYVTCRCSIALLPAWSPVTGHWSRTDDVGW